MKRLLLVVTALLVLVLGGMSCAPSAPPAPAETPAPAPPASAISHDVGYHQFMDATMLLVEIVTAAGSCSGRNHCFYANCQKCSAIGDSALRQ